MSSFVDSEADEELSDHEFGDAPQKYDSSEDEEEEEKAYAKEVDDEGNIAGLVNDESEEEDEEAEEEVGKKEKSRRKRRRAEHRLEDDDFELLEENLGVQLKKRKKFNRLRFCSSDEDEGDNEETDAKRIEKQIFQNSDFEEMAQEQPADGPRVQAPDLNVSDDEGSEDSVEDWIVSDEEGPASHGQKPRKPRDAAMSQVQEIFGADIDFSEIQKYGEGYEEDEDEEDAYYDADEDEEFEYGQRPRKKTKKPGKFKSIHDVMDPQALERGFYLDNDKVIRKSDIPESFQLRTIPVRPGDGVDDDLIEESNWIYKTLFVEPTISNQEASEDAENGFSVNRKPPSCVMKIQDILGFIRNDNFDVPYIAFYRKEYTEPHLKIHDLFKIYHWDEKWTQLVNRKANIKRLFKRMQTYQYEQISATPDKPLGDIRPLQEADLERLHPIQTMDELRDIYMHFLLYYGKDIPKMMNAYKIQQMRNRGEEVDEEVEKSILSNRLKQASRRDRYTVCFKAGLGGMTEYFGLTPGQFAENLRDNYQRHETEQYPDEPLELSRKFICPQFPTAEDALAGARYMVALQLSREPLVRQCVRQAFVERAMVTVTPTKKGRKEIDEQHELFYMKYLIDKPIKTFKEAQYLLLSNAEKEALLTIKMQIDKCDKKGNITGQTYFEEIKQLYYRDEFSHLVQEWNKQRGDVIKFMLEEILYPNMVKEMKRRLIEECEQGIKEKCALKLRSYLSKAGYQIEENDMDEEAQGVIAMGIAYPEDRSTAAFAALTDGSGELTDYLKLPDIRMRNNRGTGFSDGAKAHKNSDLQRLKDFIRKQKPHVIVIGVTDRFSTYLQNDIKNCVDELENEGMVSNIAVELMDNELAIVYSATNRANAAFREFPFELRQAISLARRIQEPLLEFSQLCTPDEDILCLKLHPLQDQLDKDQLLEALYEEFIFRACEVGVDVNRAIAHPHTANIVQFVSGLGPRKAAHLLKVLEQKDGRLENRSKLVTLCKMGPKIFINCAGFIKIDTKSLEDSSSYSTSYIEVLDGLRVHPETYDWARKMAVDALEYDESADDNNPSSAISEILMSPERLKDLDLDAFAEELERQGLGKRQITLYDIRNELNSRYKDFREPYRPPTLEQRFEMVTKENLSAFDEGKLVTCQVSGIAYRKPNTQNRGEAQHTYNPNGTWSCAFCNRDDFTQLSQVWQHVDDGDCLGRPVGVRTRFENGMTGFIPLDKLSDSQVNDPLERVKPGMTIHCRVLKLDIERFSVDLSTRGSDLRGEKLSYLHKNDDFFDFDMELSDKHKNDKKKDNNPTYLKRVIAHPNFHNVDFKKAESMLRDMDDGDVIIRPSSKGADHLKVTWRVTKEVCAHIEVLEEKKENSFSLGKSLWIGQEEFEDLDEIIARYVQPMASNARDLITHKNFRDDMIGAKDKIDEELKAAKKSIPSRIPYYITASTSLPGKFLLSYLPKTRPKHEYVTVTPDGFRYRGQIFTTINQLLRWFKEHFQDPIPAHLMQRSMPPSSSNNVNSSRSNMATPAAMSRTTRTPGRHTPRTPKSTPLPRTPHTPSMPYVTPDAYSTQIPPSPKGTMLPPRTPPARMFTQKKPREHHRGTPNFRQTPTATDTDWGRKALEWRERSQIQASPRTPRQPPVARTPVDVTPNYR